MVCGEPRQPGLAASVHESGSSRPGQRPQRSDRSLQRDSHGALGDGCGVEPGRAHGWWWLVHVGSIVIGSAWEIGYVSLWDMIHWNPLIIDHLAWWVRSASLYELDAVLKHGLHPPVSKPHLPWDLWNSGLSKPGFYWLCCAQKSWTLVIRLDPIN